MVGLGTVGYGVVRVSYCFPWDFRRSLRWISYGFPFPIRVYFAAFDQPTGVLIPVMDGQAVSVKVQEPALYQPLNEPLRLLEPLGGGTDHPLVYPGQIPGGRVVQGPEPETHQMPNDLDSIDAKVLRRLERLWVIRESLVYLNPTHCIWPVLL